MSEVSEAYKNIIWPEIDTYLKSRGFKRQARNWYGKDLGEEVGIINIQVQTPTDSLYYSFTANIGVFSKKVINGQKFNQIFFGPNVERIGFLMKGGGTDIWWKLTRDIDEYMHYFHAAHGRLFPIDQAKELARDFIDALESCISK